jgi:hypothetical protein
MPETARPMSWRIDVDGGCEPISGTVRDGDGRGERFVGWSQLFALLMRLADAIGRSG